MRVRILAVSGHDPTGGAGIQADVEVAADFGLAASSLITALTVQSTSDALEISPVPVETVAPGGGHPSPASSNSLP